MKRKAKTAGGEARHDATSRRNDAKARGPKRMMHDVEVPFRVRYSETDAMGVAYHAHYLSWFELGRTEWIRVHFAPYREFEARGLLLPLTASSVRYVRAARYDDALIVRARLSAFGPLRLTFVYAVRRADDGVIIAEGETHHAWVDRAFRPRPLSKAWPEAYARLSALSEGGDTTRRRSRA